MYTIMVAVLLYESGDDSGRYIGGLFESLRLSPNLMELNILLRVQYDPIIGYVRTPETMSVVFCPKDGFGNFFKAFLRYLIEPSYGKIYRQ